MRIALVGDVMLGRLVNNKLKHSDPAYPWGNTLSILQNADLRLCNLECVLSDIGSPWSATLKVFHFRSDEKNIKTLQAAQINIVSIANNHVLDYEYEALLRMLDILDEQKISHIGAGTNLSEASKPAFCQIEGQRIACIGFTDNEPDWAAEENKPGILYVPANIHDKRMQDLIRQIENLRKEVDFLVISAHWGPNWGYDPPREHTVIAHAMIDAGADLVFGHSGHVFRGMEVYKNRPIIYSAGDFIDDYAVDEVEKNDESFIFVLEKKGGHLKLYLYPTCIGRFQANLASPYDQRLILSKMENLCKNLGSNFKCFSDYGLLEIFTNEK